MFVTTWQPLLPLAEFTYAPDRVFIESHVLDCTFDRAHAKGLCDQWRPRKIVRLPASSTRAAVTN